MRALALALIVAVPHAALAQRQVRMGPAYEQEAGQRQPADARRAPRLEPNPNTRGPRLMDGAEQPAEKPLYRSWVLWTGLGALTASALAIVLAVVLWPAFHRPIPTSGACPGTCD